MRAPLLSRLLRSHRLVVLLVAIALMSLAAGYGLRDAFGATPEGQQAAPPPVGVITAPVEQRQITASVTGRAEISFSDQVDVNPAVPEGTTDAVVTGQVPKEGTTFSSGDVVLEVSGRPIFLLAGKLPIYRSLGPGSRGPDVVQLRGALARLGFAAGIKGVDSYDQPLANAVKALYEKKGYPPPAPAGETSSTAVDDAAAAAVDARAARDQALAQEKAAVNAIAKQRAAAKTAKKQAERELAAAQRVYAKDRSPASLAVVAAAKDALSQAKAAMDAAATLSTADAHSASESAERAAERADKALAAAKQAAWTPLPASEIIVVTSMPRKVQAVNVALGQRLGTASSSATDRVDAPAGDAKPAVVLSGLKPRVSAQVSQADAALLTKGGSAIVQSAAGDISGTIESIADAQPAAAQPVPGGNDPPADGGEAGGQAQGQGGNQVAVTIALGEVPKASAQDLAGNFTVVFTVGSSAPDSLIVPLAAVHSTATKGAFLDVVNGPLRHDVAAADQPTRHVAFTPGISAQGFVEVTAAQGKLTPQDLVVVGAKGPAESASPTPEPGS